MKILKCVALFGVVTNIVIVLTNSSAVTDFLNITEVCCDLGLDAVAVRTSRLGCWGMGLTVDS
eukprot:42711-Rhodomonas_salina.2